MRGASPVRPHGEAADWASEQMSGLPAAVGEPGNEAVPLPHVGDRSERTTTSRALILSGSIGYGHASVAAACAEALADTALSPAGTSVPVADCIDLLGPVRSRLARGIFRAALSIPSLYDGFHFAQLRAEGPLARAGDGASTRRVLDALDAAGLIEDLGLVLTVFATGAEVAAELARRRPGCRSVVFCTDATVHARWVTRSVDLYVATCDLAASSLRRYAPHAEIVIVPPPVRASFFDAPGSDEARRRFGIPVDATAVLLVGGGWGLGPIAQSARALTAAGHHVLAVAGSNRGLKARLDAMARVEPRLQSLGFCRDMPAAMAAADVVVSGAGQTSNEAHVVGRRLVVLDVVPGHGRENLLQEVMTFSATAASPSPDSVVEGVALTLKRDEPEPTWPVSSAAEWRTLFLRSLEPLGVL